MGEVKGKQPRFETLRMEIFLFATLFFFGLSWLSVGRWPAWALFAQASTVILGATTFFIFMFRTVAASFKNNYKFFETIANQLNAKVVYGEKEPYLPELIMSTPDGDIKFSFVNIGSRSLTDAGNPVCQSLFLYAHGPIGLTCQIALADLEIHLKKIPNRIHLDDSELDKKYFTTCNRGDFINNLITKEFNSLVESLKLCSLNIVIQENQCAIKWQCPFMINQDNFNQLFEMTKKVFLNIKEAAQLSGILFPIGRKQEFKLTNGRS